MKNLYEAMNNLKSNNKVLKENKKALLKEEKLVWSSEVDSEDADDFEIDMVLDDFKTSFLPAIANQCRDDVLILAGTVGRWNGDFNGGKVIDVDDLLSVGNVDRIDIVEDNNQLFWKGYHHDGHHTMGLFTIPNDEISRKKIVKDLGIVDWLKEMYDYDTEEEAIEDGLSRLDSPEDLNDILSPEDYAKANEYFKPITWNGPTVKEEKKLNEDFNLSNTTWENADEYDVDEGHKILNILNNLDLEVVDSKVEDGTISVAVKDKSSGITFWMDYQKDSKGDLVGDWNQYTFQRSNRDDMIKKAIQSSYDRNTNETIAFDEFDEVAYNYIEQNHLGEEKEESKEIVEDTKLTIQGLTNTKNLADQFQNYKAFESNFGPVVIVKVNNEFLVFKADATNYDQYIYHTSSKDNIEGWLYGTVQAKNNIFKTESKKEEGLAVNKINKDTLDMINQNYGVKTESVTIDEIEDITQQIEAAEDMDEIQQIIYSISDGVLEDEVQNMFDGCDENDDLDEVKSLVLTTLEDNAEYEDDDNELMEATTKTVLDKIKDIVNKSTSNEMTAETVESDGIAGLRLTRKNQNCDLIKAFDEIVRGLTQANISRNDYEIELKGNDLVLAIKNKELKEDKDIESTVTELTNKPNDFKYAMLSRMISDCRYFLGNGNRAEKHLWAGNVEDQITLMKALYNSFKDNEKPEWTSMDEIEGLEKEMKNNNLNESAVDTSQEFFGHSLEDDIDEYEGPVSFDRFLQRAIDFGVEDEAFEKYGNRSRTSVNKLVREYYKDYKAKMNQAIKSNNINEAETPEAMQAIADKQMPEGGYRYMARHAVGPGTLPKGVKVFKTEETPNGKIAMYISRPLTSAELKKYDIDPEWIQEDQYDAERRQGRPGISKIAEEEYYDNEEWYKEHIKDYKDEEEFVKQNIAEISSEYNVKRKSATLVCKEIYKLATK